MYHGTLRATGEELAVKVQRPDVLYEVALDLYMVRALATLTLTLALTLALALTLTLTRCAPSQP